MAEVTVLGLGRMGEAMARRLLAAGETVTVWNRTRATADALAAEGVGVRVAAELPEAVAGADAVLCTLSDGNVTRDLLLDPQVLAALSADTIVCDMGTSGVDVARALAEGFAASGKSFVDAPVSGSVATVSAGDLLVMASGARDDVVRVTPIMAAFARKVTYVGPAGAGQAMKLAVNLLVHGLNAALSESLLLASRAGIEPGAAYDVFQDSVVGSPFVRYKRGAFLQPAAPVAMSLDLVAKDLGLITDLAKSLGVPVPTTEAVATVVAQSRRAGFGPADMASLHHYLALGSL